MAKPLKRRRKSLTQAPALSDLSGMGEAQKERMELWLKAEKQRDDSFLEFQERQAQLNRDHELRMMQLMVNLQNRPVAQPSFQHSMVSSMPMAYSQPTTPNYHNSSSSNYFAGQGDGPHFTEL